MADEVPAYEKMREESAASHAIFRRTGGPALSKARASMGQAEVKRQPRMLSGSDRMAASSMGIPTGRRFAKVMATPGKGGLQMPGSGEGSPGAGARTPGAGVARLDEKSSTAPAGYAQSGIISRGAGAGGGGSAGRIRRDCQRDKRKSAGPVRERRRPWRPYGKRLKENGRRIRLWPARGPFRPIGHGPQKGRGRGPDIRRPLRARKRRREVAALVLTAEARAESVWGTRINSRPGFRQKRRRPYIRAIRRAG